MQTIALAIDGVEVKTTEDRTVFQAAQDAGIYIPNLCVLRYMKLLVGACRLCVVEVEGEKGPVGSCTLPVKEGMVVQTNTPKLVDLRRKLLKNTLGQHPCICLTCHRLEHCSPADICLRTVSAIDQHCVTCPANGRCEFQRLVLNSEVEEAPPYACKGFSIMRDNPFIVLNYDLCVMCGRCVWACREVVGANAIDFEGQGREAVVKPTSGTLAEAGCTFCGACVEVCPTGALMDREEEWQPWGSREAAVVRCKYACPVRIDVPRFIRYLLDGRYDEALAVIRDRVPFVGLVGLVCRHPCEMACRRGRLDQSVAIRALERFLVERAGAQMEVGPVAPASGKRVAVVGAGPAGLTAAYYLAKMGGHQVTVFEALPQPGGMMRVGIPEFRLPRGVLDSTVEIVTRLGVEIKTDSKVESVDELFGAGFDAIFLAIGAHAAMKLGIEGESHPGVWGGLSFLRQVSLGGKVEVGRRVAIVGGDDTTIDAARVALRLGAESVLILSPGAREELSAPAEEVEAAIEEGIRLEAATAVARIAGTDGGFKLYCTGEAGAERLVEADTVIVAWGRRPELPDGFGLERDDGGTIRVAPDSLMTSRRGVFAGGEAVTGPLSVVEAIAAGRKAATSIDRYLGGDGNIDEVLAPAEEMSPWAGRDEEFARRQRQTIPRLLVAERLQGWSQVELGFTEEAAVEEARRCLGCSRRFIVARMLQEPDLVKRVAR